LLEGISFRMLSLKDIMTEIGGDLQEIRASGGFTQSQFWLQMITDALNCELQVPSWGETSSLGAAFWSLLASGVLAGIEEIPAKISIKESLLPNPLHAQKYKLVYSLYQNLYQAVNPSFNHLAAIKSSFLKGN
jgi:gluconokinase